MKTIILYLAEDPNNTKEGDTLMEISSSQNFLHATKLAWHHVFAKATLTFSQNFEVSQVLKNNQFFVL